MVAAEVGECRRHDCRQRGRKAAEAQAAAGDGRRRLAARTRLQRVLVEFGQLERGWPKRRMAIGVLDHPGSPLGVRQPGKRESEDFPT
jgi:hypothetical protein